MFRPLSDVLQRHINKSGVSRQLEANQVLHIAVQVVEGLFRTTSGVGDIALKGEYFKQGTVFLSVTSGIIAEEIRLRHDELVRAINEKLGNETVKQLRVFIGAPH